MTRVLSLLLMMLCNTTAYGQYYFNDIISTQAGNEQYRLLRARKIQSVTASSFEADNSPTEGFSLVQEISLDGKKVSITATTGTGRKSTIIHSYELGKLKKTQSDNNGIDSRTDYFYNNAGKVQRIQFITNDTAMRSSLVEVHDWIYDENGQVISMRKIKNKLDTTLVELVKDETGNIVEEHWKKGGRTIETYYYYYTPKKELTDIVRYNAKLKKLMPDYVYDYDASGRIVQATQFSLGSGNYFTWKYSHNDKGLKQQETCFDKTKKQVGRIEYSYQ